MPITDSAVANSSAHIVSASLWAGSLLVIMICSIAIMGILSWMKKTDRKSTLIRAWGNFLFTAAKKPAVLLIACYVAYESMALSYIYIPSISTHKLFFVNIATYCLRIAEFTAFFWLIINTLNLSQQRIETWAINNNQRMLSYLLPVISSTLKGLLILLMLNMLIPELGFTGIANEALQKGAKVILIGIIGRLLWLVVNALEKIILNQYSMYDANDPVTRKILTQVKLLKKIILVLGSVVTIAATLMVFDSVRNLGTGLLTTAGLVSAIGAFASQQSLGRIFSGLQIAFSQPFTIGDTVIVDQDLGIIEEITLFYIVVKTWDLRRIVLPSDYFTNKGLQNLSLYSSELLGTIFFYTDFTLPVDVVREKFKAIVAESPFWNEKLCVLDVTDIKQSCMELRGLVSANDSGIMWKLRCEVREKLMRFIVENYPESLARSRQLSYDDVVMDKASDPS